MLDIIFALGHVVRSLKGCTSSKAAQQIFITRVNRALTLNIIGQPSLKLVHTLILMARYYQHQGLSNRNWVVVGMLIRVAQGLGLHVDVPGESQAQREERRRTWCACTTLDRFLPLLHPLCRINIERWHDTTVFKAWLLGGLWCYRLRPCRHCRKSSMTSIYVRTRMVPEGSNPRACRLSLLSLSIHWNFRRLVVKLWGVSPQIA